MTRTTSVPAVALALAMLGACAPREAAPTMSTPAAPVAAGNPSAAPMDSISSASALAAAGSPDALVAQARDARAPAGAQQVARGD